MRSNVRGNGRGATLRGLGSWKYDAFEEVGQTLHFLRIGAARVQECAARAIYRSRGFGGELHDVARRARRVVEIDVGQTFPTAANTDDLPFVFGAAIHHALDNGIEAGHVAASRENSNTANHTFILIAPAREAGLIEIAHSIPECRIGSWPKPGCRRDRTPAVEFR